MFLNHLFTTIILVYLLKKYRKQVVFSVVFFIFGALIITAIDYSYQNILKPHQKERIDNLIGKEKNTLGSGYNLNQSLIRLHCAVNYMFFSKSTAKKIYQYNPNAKIIFCLRNPVDRAKSAYKYFKLTLR